MEKVEKLDKAEFDLVYDENISRLSYEKLREKVISRIGYIWNKILEIQGRKLSDWYDFDNGDRGNAGEFDENRYSEEVTFYGQFESLKYESSFSHGFPTRFLWEDFEDEVMETDKREKGEDEQRRVNAKLKMESRKKRLLELRKVIESKLTKEELSAINFKV